MCTETKDARVHCTILNDHTNQRPPPPTGEEGAARPRKHNTQQNQAVVLSGPNSAPNHDVSTFSRATPSHTPTHRPGQVPEPSTTNHRCAEHTPATTTGRQCSVKLLRKEVIQPHLPVRLPCYDFVPIASPTFDGSLHKG